MKNNKLKIFLAAPRGFCAGVERALEIVDGALGIFGTPIYVRHEIVHNKHVVNRLKSKGVCFVEDVSEVPDNSVVIFSAHGVSKKVRVDADARNIKVIDATCPLVTKVHMEVHRLNRKGYKIILIGHAGHIEVEGTMGQLPPGEIILVRNTEEVQNIQVDDPDKVAYVTQTTLSIDETADIVQSLLKRFPNLRTPPKEDICYATQNRQNTIKALVGSIDLLIVIGSKNSSNSNRLVEVARSHGLAGYLIDEPDELKEEWFKGVEKIGLTAGASAPEDLVQTTLEYLLEKYGGEVIPFIHKKETVDFPLPRELKTLKV